MPAEVVRVVDGDTVRLRLDLGWHVTREENCRILGVDAPERFTAQGKLATAWAEQQLPAGLQVVFASHALDKYGRPLGTIAYGGPPVRDFGSDLLAAGHAVPYSG